MLKLFPLLSHMNPGGGVPPPPPPTSSSYYNVPNLIPGVNSPVINYNGAHSAEAQSNHNNGGCNPPPPNVSEHNGYPSEQFGDLASKIAQFQRLRAMLDFQQQQGPGNPLGANPPVSQCLENQGKTAAAQNYSDIPVSGAPIVTREYLIAIWNIRQPLDNISHTPHILFISLF